MISEVEINSSKLTKVALPASDAGRVSVMVLDFHAEGLGALCYFGLPRRGRKREEFAGKRD
jgi:hypothetical protein